MRHARSRIRDGRRMLAALLLGGYCVCGWGCHQHHYYYYGASGAANPCAPGTASGAVLPSNVTVGPVCEVPSTVVGGEPVVTTGPSTIIENGRAKPKVVVSQPERRPSRYGWRSANPEDVPAFTQIDGAVGGTRVK